MELYEMTKNNRGCDANIHQDVNLLHRARMRDHSQEG